MAIFYEPFLYIALEKKKDDALFHTLQSWLRVLVHVFNPEHVAPKKKPMFIGARSSSSPSKQAPLRTELMFLDLKCRPSSI